MKLALPRFGSIAAAVAIALSAVALPASPASAAPAALPRSAFGMHFTGWGSHSYPALGFGTARIWDMGVDWADLQPSAPPPLTTGVYTDSWDQSRLSRLDSIVDGFHARHVDPILVLGFTPSWAANTSCSTYSSRPGTCAPSSTDGSSYWAKYVQALVQRYDGNHGHAKVTYFETWNEGNISYGYSDSAQALAAMQATAYAAVHGNNAGQRLLSASFALSTGNSPACLCWLSSFLGYAGGKSYDIFDAHLYPTLPTAKANWGPEWTMVRLGQLRKTLSSAGAPATIWNTEVNVGSPSVKFTGTAGAAQVARVLVLNTENHIARTIWYAADTHAFGGVWLEGNDNKTFTAAGVAYRYLANRLTGARPYGCSSKKVGTNKYRYLCRYHLSNGKNFLAVWTTGSSYQYYGPRGTQDWYTVTGGRHAASYRTRLTVSHIPVFVYGTFKI